MTQINTESINATAETRKCGDGADILCVCFGTTRDDVREYMSRPGCSVDDMIQETKIGTKCTACLLDLDITLHDIQQSRGSGSAVDRNSHIENLAGSTPVEHLDSAFFVCKDGIKTILRIANFTPMFEEGPESVAHNYTLWLIGEDGRIAVTDRGVIGANTQIEIDFSQLAKCPSQGWFLISCIPTGPGFYGTLRPQALLVGDTWASSYHVQPQYAASNVYRRLSIVIKSAKHLTHSSLYIFNGERNGGKIIVEVDSRESDFHGTCNAYVAANGMCVVDLDKEIASFPESECMLVTVESETITKKYLATVQPDGQWSADHFPTLP